MMKKAQGMSMNVIIIAVIALVVLIVLVLVFTGKTKFFGKQTSDTASQFTGQRCAIPGTSNKCLDETTCNNQGGAWTQAPVSGGYSDEGYCPGCCSF
jgi:hypothetical protein